MKKLSIGTILITVFILMLIVVGAISLESFTSLEMLGTELENIGHHRIPDMQLIGVLNTEHMSIRAQTLDVWLSQKMEQSAAVAYVRNIQKQREKSWEAVDAAMAELKQIPRATQKGRDLMAKLEGQYKAWRDVYEELDGTILQLANSSNDEERAGLYAQYQVAIDRMIPISNAMGNTFTELTETNTGNTHIMVEESVANSHHSMILIIFMSAFGIALGILISVILPRKIMGQIKGIVRQFASLSHDVQQGRLDSRGDPDATTIDFRGIVENANELIEAFIKPIKETADYIERISKGDIPERITATYHGDFNVTKDNLNQCIDTLNKLMADVEGLVSAAVDGRLLERANADAHQGSYRDIVIGLNDTIDRIVMLVDSAPCPFMIVDKQFNIQFMNKTGANVVNKSQSELVGKKCYEQFKTGDCNTERCALSRAMKTGQMQSAETDAHPGGLDLDIKYEGVPIRDRNGQINGALEVVIDQTDIKNAQRLSNKITAYQKEEVGKLVNRLQNLADGNLQFETGIAATDKDTYETGSRFEAINSSLAQVKKAIGLLTEDAQVLVKAALDGKLSTRAQANKHKGEYQALMRGINNLLDAIINPINEAMDVMRELANKNLTMRVKGSYKGDLNEFKQNINNAGDNLEDALTQVDRAVQQISTAAGEISNGSQSLASGSSQQASSLEEIASSLEEMNSLTLNNADNSRQGMALSEESLVHVKKGNDAMSHMNNAMEAIAKSAKETSNIIKTINDIAFQTNLLALNAAVEAAHAGEAGKGFAVVAEEVKNLALRSAEAAKNTDELIESSLRNSLEGARIVSEVTKAFEDIKASFSKVNNIVKEVSVSSDEQAEGIRQVNVAVGELNKVTQGNAANAEESASAAEELNSQSAELRSMVGEFKLSQSMANVGMNRRFEVGPSKVSSLPSLKSLPGPGKDKYTSGEIEILLPMDEEHGEEERELDF